MTSDVLLPIAIPILIVLVWLFNCLNIMREYERAVVFRLGRVLKKEKGPGLVLTVEDEEAGHELLGLEVRAVRHRGHAVAHPHRLSGQLVTQAIGA